MNEARAGVIAFVRLALVVLLGAAAAFEAFVVYGTITGPSNGASKPIAVPASVLLCVAVALMFVISVDDFALKGFMKQRGLLSRLHITLWIAGAGALFLSIGGGFVGGIAFFLLPPAMLFVVFSLLSGTFMAPAAEVAEGPSRARRGGRKRRKRR